METEMHERWRIKYIADTRGFSKPESYSKSIYLVHRSIFHVCRSIYRVHRSIYLEYWPINQVYWHTVHSEHRKLYILSVVKPTEIDTPCIYRPIYQVYRLVMKSGASKSQVYRWYTWLFTFYTFRLPYTSGPRTEHFIADTAVVCR